ncbi:hypothetical protein QEM13_002434 [Pseudomonas putida]|nr:hypothetical protein [Pseudomonas putida]
MTVQAQSSTASSTIAYFQIFRIYHAPGHLDDCRPLFNNSRQRIPLTIEALARDRYGRKVDMSAADLASMELIEVTSSGNPVGEPLPYDVGYEELTGWSSYRDPGLFVYDETVVRQLSFDDPNTPNTPNTIVDVHQGVDAVEVDKIHLWVATGDSTRRIFAAKFHEHISTCYEGATGRITLEPKEMNKALVTFDHPEKLVYQLGNSGEETWWRMYHYYISAHTVHGQVPLRYIAMRGLWWDSGEEYKAKYSFCLAAHSGETSPVANDLPEKLGIDGVHPLKTYPIRNPPFVNPQAGKVIVFMCLSPFNTHFYNGSERAQPVMERLGDITDLYGNVYGFNFRYARWYEHEPRRALRFERT